MTHKLLDLVVLVLLVPGNSFATSYPTYSTIPVEQCRVGGIGIGTDYKDAIDTLGPADEEKGYGVSASSAGEAGTALMYKDLHLAFSHDRLVMLNVTGVGLALSNGISVGSFEEDVIEAFGVQPIPMGDARTVLGFICVEPNEEPSRVLMELHMIEGAVDYIILHKIS